MVNSAVCEGHCADVLKIEATEHKNGNSNNGPLENLPVEPACVIAQAQCNAQPMQNKKPPESETTIGLICEFKEGSDLSGGIQTIKNVERPLTNEIHTLENQQILRPRKNLIFSEIFVCITLILCMVYFSSFALVKVGFCNCNAPSKSLPRMGAQECEQAGRVFYHDTTGYCSYRIECGEGTLHHQPLTLHQERPAVRGKHWKWCHMVSRNLVGLVP